MYQQKIRNRVDINRDITLHVEKTALVSAEVDDSIIAVYTRTITDLEEERTTAMNYERYISTRIRRMIERDSITEELFTEDNGESDSLGQTENV